MFKFSFIFSREKKLSYISSAHCSVKLNPQLEESKIGERREGGGKKILLYFLGRRSEKGIV